MSTWLFFFCCRFTYWSSAAISHPLRGLMRCVFRDALLHAVIRVVILLSVTSLALLLWPLTLTTRFCSQNCCSLHHSPQKLETVVRESPWRSAVSEIFKPPCLARIIIPWSKSLRSHFFTILTFGLKNSWTSWPCMCVFMILLAATWLADSIFALTSWCTGLPNKVPSECILSW